MKQPSSQAGQPAQGFFQLFRLRCPARLGLIDGHSKHLKTQTSRYGTKVGDTLTFGKPLSRQADWRSVLCQVSRPHVFAILCTSFTIPCPQSSIRNEWPWHICSRSEGSESHIALSDQQKAKLNIEIAGHKVFQVSTRSLASTHCSSTSSPSCSRRNSGSTRRDKKPPSSRSWVCVCCNVFTVFDTEITNWVTESMQNTPTAGPMGSVSRMHLNRAGKKKIEV